MREQRRSLKKYIFRLSSFSVWEQRGSKVEGGLATDFLTLVADQPLAVVLGKGVLSGLRVRVFSLVWSFFGFRSPHLVRSLLVLLLRGTSRGSWVVRVCSFGVGSNLRCLSCGLLRGTQFAEFLSIVSEIV